MSKRWNYPHDAEPAETYYEYVERKKSEEASTNLAVLVFKVMFKTIRAVFVYLPLLYIGYLITSKITLRKSIDDLQNIGLIILFSYFLFAIIYFLKGILIGLKQKRNLLWIALWLLCVAVACVIPALFMQTMVEGLIVPSKRMLTIYQILTWCAGLLFGIYVYTRYKFAIHCAPKIVYWSYSLGLKLIRR